MPAFFFVVFFSLLFVFSVVVVVPQSDSASFHFVAFTRTDLLPPVDPCEAREGSEFTGAIWEPKNYVKVFGLFVSHRVRHTKVKSRFCIFNHPSPSRCERWGVFHFFSYIPTSLFPLSFTESGGKGGAAAEGGAPSGGQEDPPSDCLPCQQGCAYCKDDAPCVAQEDGALRLAVLSFQCLCLLIVFVSMILIYHFRRNKVRGPPQNNRR